MTALEKVKKFEEESLKKVEAYKREVLADLYIYLEKGQQCVFNRLYDGGLSSVTVGQLNTAIRQCERTEKKITDKGW